VGRVVPDVSEMGTALIFRVKKVLLDSEYEKSRIFEKS
jgi:hypothetical protein